MGRDDTGPAGRTVIGREAVMHTVDLPGRRPAPDISATDKTSVRRGWLGVSGVDLVPLCIVLAEDHDDTRWLLADALRLDGHDVIEAGDGVELMDVLARSTGVDLVVADLRMPRVDGLEAFRRIRLTGSAVPLLLMTAFATEPVHREASRSGAVGVLHKPFEIPDFRTLALVAGRRRRVPAR